VCLYGPLLLFALYAFVATRRHSPNRSILYSKILIVAGMVISLLVIFSLLTPRAYRITGRAQPATVWHHVIMGFGANPSWPFGDLADQYRGCMPGQPNSSLVPGVQDLTGVCVWAAYAKRNGMSVEGELYDKNFDTATREAVLTILWQYPAQSLMTFIYYKPLTVLHTLALYFDFSIPTSWPVRMLIICQIAVFLVFVALNRSCLAQHALRPIYFGFGLAALSACGLYIVAYSTPLTSLDLFFYLLAFIGIAIAGLVAGVARLIPPSSPSAVSMAARHRPAVKSEQTLCMDDS
jgi:hypothetical protein